MKPTVLPVKKAGIIFLWLLAWQAASMFVHNSIILVGPLEVIQALWIQAAMSGFWKTIAFSFGKISLGFLLAFVTGILAGGAAWRFPLLKDLLEPLMSLIKSVPVASFVILALIWVGSENLSVFIAFLVVFPIIYINTMAGFMSTDPKLLEMARVFHMQGKKKLLYIYRPALLPYLISGCRVALGMGWKSGVAAEVIGVPNHSIGEKLYMAKIYLSTADLFAWTLVIIVISALFEKFFLWLLSLADAGLKSHKKQEV
ncbi:MAG: ABC transporter permease subunit [Hungatella sp.]|jgi:NitT/TauT family transport system permease protein|nr:ABC transporter permease subunit [Hungatella sp.]